MTTNVNSEFISKVRELQKSMRDLANFWQDNLEALEDLNVGKSCLSNDSLHDLAFDTFNWYETLISNYSQK